MTTYSGNPFTALVRTIKDHGKRIKVLEQRVNDARSKLANSRGIQGSITAAQMAALATLTAAQLDALQTLSVAQINAMNTITSTQYTLLGTTNITFLAGLGTLPNQSDTNSTLTGVCNWANNLTDHLVSNGYMSP